MILTSITSDFINNKNLNMKNFTNQNQRSYTDLVSTDAVKSRKLSLLWLMLLMLLFVPTRMVALTTTEDPRCAMFNDLDGISNATFTDNGDWPWQMLDLNAEGMTDLGFDIPEGSTGLMSGNYKVNGYSSVTVVNFRVEKPILISFKYLVSSNKNQEPYIFDEATITLDNNESWTISEKKQIEIKALLSVGEHSLKLYYWNARQPENCADRAIIYDLKTATSISDFVAEYDATNTTLTFKKITYDNLENLDLNRTVIVNDEPMVKVMCNRFNIATADIKKIVFEESFKTYAPTSLREFFQQCNQLETISGLEYLNTANVTNMRSMFDDCSALTSLDLTKFNTEKVTDMFCMFSDCSALTSLDLTKFNNANVRSMKYMFSGCSALKSLDLTKFNTDKVTDMGFMFEYCSALTSLDLTNFNTANVTNMYQMFYGCSALESLVLTKFNTANVTDMSYMFYGCSSLPSLDLRYFNTANVTDIYSMFEGCSALTSLDLSNFTTENVTEMYLMFKGCSALESLVLTNFNTEKVTDMKYMFYGCSSLKSLDLTNFNTANVKDIYGMFEGCSALKSLILTNFNTANVTDMSRMFYKCSALTSLDLTKFNTAEVTDMSRMFYKCSALTTIYASENFVTTKVSSGSKMFNSCEKLNGFIDYINNTDKTDHTYANYKTGYFTKLVGKNGEEKIGAVGEPLTAESLALADNKDFVAYEPFTATAASYSREMNAGTTWATLCLPFEVSLDGQHFRAFKLLSVSADVVELEEIKTSIAAGTPVIIKMNEGKTALNFSVADKEIAHEVVSAADGSSYQLQGIYTQKKFSKEADNNCYIVKGNKLMNPVKLLENTNNKTVGSKPFRAYMIDNTTAPAAGAKMFSIGFDNDGTTAIDHLNANAGDEAEYYDLQGHRLNEPQKGINIVKRGGKTMKIIIK